MKLVGWQQLSIRWKLSLVIILVCSLVSISQIAVYTIYDEQTYLEYKRVKTRVMADIIGANAIPALKFRDRGDALEILRSLATEKTIRSAYLFHEDGGLLAEYVRDGVALSVPILPDNKKSESFDDDRYVLIHKIISDDRELGTLLLNSDLDDLKRLQNEGLILGGLIGAIFFLLSAALALWLQRSFTTPIKDLITTIRRIADNKDFSARASKNSTDEFGELVDWFNHMLAEVGKRDAQLAEQMHMLERSNKELDQFVYVASHDLKAPLRAVENLSRMIVKAIKDVLPPDKQELLDLLQSRVKRMERLLDDLLAYSRVGRVRTSIETIDCKALTHDIINLMAPPKTFKFGVPDTLPIINTDRVPLEQVIRNLIGNAVKHHNRQDGKIDIDVRDLGKELEFSVTDDGGGIPPQYHEKIFQMFQTLKPRDEVEGSGMGLALVKKIVEEHKGRVWLHSQEGAGSSFHFTWPKV